MGNQNSRLDRSGSSATINDDPCLDNMRQWHSSKKSEPYKRQYPLPTIANDHNRVKPRKQSSPAAVSSFTSNSGRKPFARFFHRHNKLTRNNSCIDTTTHTLSAAAAQQQQQQQVINNSHSNNHISNSPNNTTNTTTCSTSSSFNSQQLQQQVHFIHPLAPTTNSHIATDQRSCHHIFPFENESFSRPSLEVISNSRRLGTHTANSSNRNSLSNAQLKLLLAQQHEIPYSYRLNGKRKYHQVPGSNYLLPCDDEEIDRLHLQHFMIRFAIQGYVVNNRWPNVICLLTWP